LDETPAVAAVYDRRFYGNSKQTCRLRDTLKPAVIDRRYSDTGIVMSRQLRDTTLDIIKGYSKADGIDPIDAILAATAIAGEMTLSTRNGKHFRNIKGLQLEIVRYPKESDAQN